MPRSQGCGQCYWLRPEQPRRLRTLPRALVSIGDGTENRVNICLKVCDFVEQSVLDMENEAGVSCSCLKGGVLKAKMNIDRMRFFDKAKESTNKPDKLRGFEVNALAHVRGKWSTKTSSGLSIELTDIQILERSEQETCPF